MGPHQVLVGHVDARGADLARHHELGPAEEPLVMGAASRAVGEDQRRLAAATGPPGALGVVGRRGRHVAEVDHVELGDVDAQLHGGRAVEHGQGGVAEAQLALLALERRHLGGVLASLHAHEVTGQVAIEVDKEGVGNDRDVGRAGSAHRIVVRPGPLAGPPAHGRGRYLVAGDAVAGDEQLLDQPGPS